MPLEATSPLAEEKRQLRKTVLNRRSALSTQERSAKSEVICKGVARLLGIASNELTDNPRQRLGGETSRPHRDSYGTKTSAGVLGANESIPGTRLQTGSTTALYSAFEDEVDLSLLAKRCYEAGLRVAFPCMNPRNEPSPMCMREVDERSWADTAAPFVANPLMRLHLDDTALARFPIVAPETLDAIVVPLVAFDEARHRLGYGGGNYDTFLPLISPRCLVVGVAFREQCVSRVPVEPHDLALPSIVYA